ncbi:DUF6073 family protein [Nucisporomicrobium flavum]|uniref:DUF6073 family protein n=1 Tax=Nucisporomicrobium flavum TaxID=2785915 RepID=UPI0018F6C2F2|nr:DUF6073 family protein [Nucisporomicrobium flavum]
MSQSEQSGPRSVVGHPVAWGAARPEGGIRPYQLTPGSIDTMSVRVREKIDIHGVGMDVVEMAGVFTVRRDHPCTPSGQSEPVWGESCIKTEFRGLELVGQSRLFGTVRVHLSGERASHGEVGPADQGSIAANCVAHCYPVVELPQLQMRLNTGEQPVLLASKVVQVPPVGDVARSDNSAPLIDETGTAVGEIVSSDIEVGEVLASFPLGSTGADDGWQRSKESGRHVDPSGPAFYAKTPGGTVLAGHEGHHQHPPADTTIPAPGRGPATSAPESPMTVALGEVLDRLQRELQNLVSIVRQIEESGDAGRHGQPGGGGGHGHGH